MYIASRRSVLPLPLLLCLLPHLLLIFLLLLTLTLLTVTGCGQLNVIDQFLPPLFSLARSEAMLAPPCCIFLVFFIYGLPPLGTYLFLGAYALISLYILREDLDFVLSCTYYVLFILSFLI